jgi:hypothetical protein
MQLHQRIEDVTTLAGQTVNVSFWAKADASRALTLTVLQFFGSGGSSLVTPVSAGVLGNATTSWQRFTYSFSMPQITGKTVGAGSFVDIGIDMPASALTIDFWGFQVEVGSKATPFQTATGTLQGELDACMRYYQVAGAGAVGANENTTFQAFGSVLPVTMRSAPTSGLISSTQTFFNYGVGSSTQTISSIWGFGATTNGYNVEFNTANSGVSTVNKVIVLLTNNLGLSAEL